MVIFSMMLILIVNRSGYSRIFYNLLMQVNQACLNNPLENPSQEVKKGLEISSNPLIYQLTVADEFRNSCFFSKQELDLDFEQIYQILG